MMELCWDSFYLDASYSRKNLSLQFVRDLLRIFEEVNATNELVVDLKHHLLDWIVEEENNGRLKQLIGLFHDSVQLNKVGLFL